jgi:ABC-2 type transport system permease protein
MNVPATATMSSARVLGAYLGDIGFELRKMLRSPMFALPTLIFPAMFYLLFAVFMGGARGNTQAAMGLFANYSVFGTMAPGLFGFGVSLAFERELGTLTYRQALPAPAGSYLLARMVMAMIFACIITALLTTLALFVSHLPLGFAQIARVFVVNALGVLPFCAIGLFVGALVSGQAAPAIVNLIYLPMAFFSGLWVPFQFLPKALQQLAPALPAFHLDQLALRALDLDSVGTVANHVGALAGFTLLFFWLAMRRLGNHGVSLLGPARAAAGMPVRRLAGVAMACVSIGLIITGYFGGAAKPAAVSSTAAATGGASDQTASAAPGAAGSATPAGVAAPDTRVLADFEDGTMKASYGLGWAAVDDQERGGNSTIVGRVIDDGAPGSKRALELAGTVGDGIQYPFVGASLLPAGKPGLPFHEQPLADLSAKKTLHFLARGDGRQYLVVIMGERLDAMPAMYGFTAGPEWATVDVPLAEMANLDLQRVRVISIGAMAPQGDFKLQVDDIEMR